ncbi:PilZ domain-containing protein [Sphingomonas limnosediminicola]|uniref:PilZ domain-containing protein n=1 Tax=Sphingomonas limnosediminicola TaxID=940133 RepID=UPI0031CE640C
MPGFGKRRDLAGGRRTTPRQPAVLVASAATDELSYSVVLEEVCSTGAKLRAGEAPTVGKPLVVKIGAAQISAKVVWSDGGTCGISFDEPLTQLGVRHLKEEGRWGTVIGIL